MDLPQVYAIRTQVGTMQGVEETVQLLTRVPWVSPSIDDTVRRYCHAADRNNLRMS